MQSASLAPYRIFSIAGTPVFIDITYIVLILMPFLSGSGFITGLIMCATIFVSLLIHEFGHVFANATCGHRSIVLLNGWGGLTSADGARSGWRHVWVSIAGPLAGFAAAGIFWFLLMPDAAAALRALYPDAGYFTIAGAFSGADSHSFAETVWHAFWGQMCVLNLFWSIINLVPIYPLDGGQALLELLRFRRRATAAVRLSAWISFIAIGGLVLWRVQSGGLSPFFVVIMLMLAYENWKRVAR